MKPRRVGILGGMGPAATILLQQRILDAVQVEDDEGHIPLLIDMNPQVPSRIKYLLQGDGPDPGAVLANMARGLENDGVELVAMPCNTAHHFAPQIEAALTVPFLNMVELTVSEVARVVPKGGRVGILASPATQKTELFQTAFAPHGFSVVYLQDSERVLAVIEAIKKNGPDLGHVDVLQSIMETLLQQGVEAFVIGCTEFSLIATQLATDVPVIDALDVLTEHIVQAATE